MEKRTLLSLAAVVLLGGAAFWAMRAPEKGQRVGPRARPIAAFKSSDIDGIDITNEKGEHVVLAKQGEKWRMTAPAAAAADAAGIKALLDGLDKMVFQDEVADSADKLAEFQVDDAKAVKVKLSGAGGKELADLRIGKALNGYTMVRPAGKNAVWQVSGIFPYQFTREAKAWRDHTIFEFAATDADGITVESAGQKLVLAKDKDAKDTRPGESHWKITESTGDGPKTEATLDQQQVTGAAQAMGTLHAGDFADDKKPEDVGLDKPTVTVTVVAKGQTHALEVGARSGEDVYVRVAGQPTIYSLKKYAAERLERRPIDYRDKTLVKAKEDDLQSVDITTGGETTSLERDGGKWKAKRGALDATKVKPVVSSFENVAGSSFAANRDPKTTGLGKPSGTVAVHLKDKSTTTLKIGGLTKDQSDYYVQKVGAPDVYLVKKYTVERFLKKPSDLVAPAPKENKEKK